MNLAVLDDREPWPRLAWRRLGWTYLTAPSEKKKEAHAACKRTSPLVQANATAWSQTVPCCARRAHPRRLVYPYTLAVHPTPRRAPLRLLLGP